ncbi:competence/damage-inducible protein A [Acetobacter sp. AN02]|uniref:competence/damage-inducible protein A n=1 Tax=Acetobacter sp. AN02 TaxID=2894186 RepID=UPI0024343B0E|nr:molybdopterin-binding protein [Acetobacter sp. AN02]MDG6094531.1 competence/damage-inducible protein A [Acetobacter sp. AN02]
MTSPASAMIVIGNEILSGRTRDANIIFIAGRLGEIGAPLKEVRIIPDIRETIIATVNELRARYDQVFTTGGIGPTHDDITASCIAEAFGVPFELHEPSARLMKEHYGTDRFMEARQRMAMMPRGASPIPNPVSVAPGFTMGNVHVMAGVPSIMQAMFHELEPKLLRGAPVRSVAWHSGELYESVIAAALGELQDRWPQIDIGSYPYHREDGRRGVALVAKGTDADALAAVSDSLRNIIETVAGVSATEGEPPA